MSNQTDNQGITPDHLQNTGNVVNSDLTDDELDNILDDLWERVNDTEAWEIAKAAIHRYAQKMVVAELKKLKEQVHENRGSRAGASVRGFNTAIRYIHKDIDDRITSIERKIRE